MKIIVVPCVPLMVGRRYNLARTFAEHGHEVHYLIWDLPYRLNFSQVLRHLKVTLRADEYPYDNFTMHRIRRLPFFWPLVNGWLFKYQIKKLYKKLDADIVFSQGYTNETEIPKDLPFIYDLNDDHAAMAEVYGSVIYKLAFRLLQVKSTIRRQCQNALAVTVVSQALYEKAKNYNPNVYKLPNGVNKKVIDKVRKNKATLAKNKYSIIYVTGFNQWSLPIETIEVIRQLKGEFPKIGLTLVGEGTETNRIKAHIKDNKLSKYIHYLGGVYDQEKLFTLINGHSLGLSISEKNKFRDAAQPLKVIEYSALGKKVVSTDLEEVKDLDFPNVFIFSTKDKEDGFAGAIRKAFKDIKSYEATSDLVLTDYSWDKIAGSLAKIMAERISA